MTVSGQQQVEHWRDHAIAQAAIVSDGWQVALAWLGRFAEIILFICMILMLANIVIPFASWFVGGILVIQMITLDVAAFGLGTMASHVKRSGNEETAQHAEAMSRALISIMIITALNVVIDLRFGSTYPTIHTITGYVDDVLIFVRIVAVILYGHTIRSLREVSQAIEATTQEETGVLKEQVAQLQKLLQAERRQAADMQGKLQSELQTARDDFRLQLETALASQHATLTTAESQSEIVSVLQNQLNEALQQGRFLTATLSQKQEDLHLQSAQLQTMTTNLQTTRQQILDLQNGLQTAKSSAKLQTANLQIALQEVSAKYELKQKEYDQVSAKLQTANLQIADLQNHLQTAKSSAKGNITSLDQARAKHEVAGSGRAKLSHAEILAFKTAHADLKNAEVAAQLGVSERKVYDALAWQREQQSANADVIAQ